MANFYCSSVAYAAVTAWAATSAVTVGTIRRQLATPTEGNERCFRVTTAGTTGATEPTWTITANGTTTDGTVTWTECTGQAIYNGNGGGTAWGAPFARLSTATSFFAAGDTIFIASNHNETNSSTKTILIKGTATAKIKILSVDETIVPTVNLTKLKAGATVTINSNTANQAINLQQSSNTARFGYIYGVSFSCQRNAGNNSVAVAINTLSCVFHFCKFNCLGTLQCYINFGTATPNAKTRQVFTNCTFKMDDTSVQYISFTDGSFLFQQLNLETNSINFYPFLSPAGFYSSEVIIKNSDLSKIASIFSNSVLDVNTVYLQNCLLKSGVTLPTTSPNGGNLIIDNSDSAATNIRFYKLDILGYSMQDTGISVKGLSAKLTSSTAASWDYPLSFDLSPIRVKANVPISATFEIAGSSSLTNADCWVEIDYPGSSSSPLGATSTSGTATIFTAGTTIPSSTAIWSGSPTNKQKITVTFTTLLDGWALPVIKLAKPSATVYVDLGGASLVPGDGFLNPMGGLLTHPGMTGGMRG